MVAISYIILLVAYQKLANILTPRALLKGHHSKLFKKRKRGLALATIRLITADTSTIFMHQMRQMADWTCQG